MLRTQERVLALYSLDRVFQITNVVFQSIIVCHAIFSQPGFGLCQYVLIIALEASIIDNVQVCFCTGNGCSEHALNTQFWHIGALGSIPNIGVLEHARSSILFLWSGSICNLFMLGAYESSLCTPNIMYMCVLHFTAQCSGKKCLNGGTLDSNTCTCTCAEPYLGANCERGNLFDFYIVI